MTHNSGGNPEVSANIWGKKDGESYYPLLAHMLDVATMSRALFRRWLRPGLREMLESQLGESSEAQISFLAGMHDLGKCTPIFQGALLGRNPDEHAPRRSLLESEGFAFPEVKSKRAMRESRLHRHEKLGAISVEGLSNFLSHTAGSSPLTVSMLGHHGTFEVGLHRGRRSQIDDVRPFLDSRWLEEQEKITRAILRAAGLREQPDLFLDTTALILISGLVIMADRLASSEAISTSGQEQMSSGRLCLDDPAGWLEAREAECLDFARSQIGFAPVLEKEMILGDFTPRGVQRQIGDEEHLCVIAEATGAGKTEAALLRHSLREESLTFLLPTQATTNAMMKRLEALFSASGTTVASLAHGTAFLEDFYSRPLAGSDEGLVRTDFTRVVGGRLAAAVNVATVDQMLMAALPVKWTHLRLLLLANSHLVIDEAHLLDGYQARLLEPVLSFLGRVGSRVTILSATLPDWLEQRFSDAYASRSVAKSPASFPSILSVCPEGQVEKKELPADNYEIDFEIECAADDEIEAAHIRWAKEKRLAHPKARIGIFVNQIGRAQTIARTLQDEYPDSTVLCLHSRMLPAHRKEVVEKLLRFAGTRSGESAPGGLFFVCTQAGEMSLDIDLDFLCTDLAPAPSLIQRFGRQWRDRDSRERFLRIPRAVNQLVRIIVPGEEGEIDKAGCLPYSRPGLVRARDFLLSRSTADDSGSLVSGRLRLPEDVQGFVETVKAAELDDPSMSEEELEEQAEQMILAMRGGSLAIKIDQLYETGTTVKDFGILTSSSGLDEELATRFIEYQSSIMILLSDKPETMELGALPTGTRPGDFAEKISRQQAQMAAVSVPRQLEKALEKLGVERISSNGLSAFIGELPPGGAYDPLVGLVFEQDET